MIKSSTWDRIEYFKVREFDDPSCPGSGKHIDGMLLFCMDKLRREIGYPIRTHWRAGGCVDVDGCHGHSSRSYHLLEHGAKACDFDIFCPYPLNWQFNWICRKGFGGIGIYYDWSRPGFHVDLRDPENTQHWTRSVIDGRVQYRFFIF